jgi:excisionase family DNA binding protein
VLPEPAALDGLDRDALVEVATALGGLLERVRARLATLSGALSPSDRDQYLDARDVAALLRVTEPYVYDLMKSGALPAIAFGKYRRVSIADLRAWASRQHLAIPEYLTYRSRHDRRRGASDPPTARLDATGVRGESRRRTEQRRQVGARRARRARVGASADATPREGCTPATSHETTQTEDLTDGVHS